MTVDELLTSYEIFAMSEAEKGERFERLMKNFLLTYPIWRGKISDVWLWKDFPFRNDLGSKDLGIDIVCRTRNGEFWAAQCKFYAETTTIDKPAVDSFFSDATRTFGDGKKFSLFIWIATTDRYTENAREMFKGRSPEVKIIDLDTLRRAQVNWALLDNGFRGDEAIRVRKLRDYQLEAVNMAREHFQTHTRGQLIMACGTGKTFTALKIAETLVPNGKVLFLVPSISLLRQTLEEWATFSAEPINAVCVCSDSTVAKNFEDEIVDVNLPLPALTDPIRISAALKTFRDEGLTVIFSTYQSIEVIKKLNLDFDLVICDEAHRTTGYGDKQKFFAKVHDNDFIRAHRRLYMTATPKLFKTDAKDSDNADKLSVWSMDDAQIFGEEFFRISFREAIARTCLSDYKVFVLTVNESDLNSELRAAIADKKNALTTDEVLKLIGCINALSKNVDEHSARLIADDKNFMRTAVAFNPKIKDSEHIAAIFADVQEKYLRTMTAAEKSSLVTIEAAHVDGSMKSSVRAGKLSWLKSAPENVCRVLNNVRCLSEGVDVPALDAIIFLSSRKSKVDIVQAVGRVMRTSPDKKFGYIIIPVVVPLSQSPEDALERSKDFSVVWDVLNALRAHDEGMNVEIERIRNNGTCEKILLGTTRKRSSRDPQIVITDFLPWDELRDKIFARMVEHVGNRLYWIQWANKVADIVERHTRRIKEIIATEDDARAAFQSFLDGLKQGINPALTEDDAVDMLAQHLVTRPVFEALFDNDSFAKHNPVSLAMQSILERLEGDGMTKDHEVFAGLYEHVREMCTDMGDAANRQRIITRLYDNFFRLALPKTSEKLGIVYTPVEVVDFILRSVNAVLKKNFNRTLSDENVHVLDPFAGTGTFLVRLIQSGLIRRSDLLRKYFRELHANEIVLLAYYIAAINIENAFHAAGESCQLSAFSCQENSPPLKAESSKLIAYTSFAGICLTDTFELYERGQIPLDLSDDLRQNSERVNEQKHARIEVIIGNPPYSVGQRSANDNAANQHYKNLEERIAATYAAKTNATNKNSLYDSYIKAFRWASDRIADGGVIGFVTNAGWLDGAAMDGLRKCFAEEFSEIYVFNLRGNQRTQGETSRREGGKIFGSGSRAPIAVTVLVKDPAHEGSAEIFYRDIGDYLTREQKLDIISRTHDVLSDGFTTITPNDKGDWINQRGDDFDTFIPLAPDKKFDGAAQSFFVANSRGLVTARDAWVYNLSRNALTANIQTTIDYYNTHEPTDFDPTKIVWIFDTVQDKNRGLKYRFDAAQIVDTVYRPFCKSNLYYDEYLIQRRYQMHKFFPTGNEDNRLICLNGVGSNKQLSVLIVDKTCDLGLIDKCQCFPLYWYEAAAQGSLFGEELQRRDGITDFIMQQARLLYGAVTREDVFYYVYGFLHLPSYREKFSAELKKSLPRIILLDDAQKFWQLSKAGRDLADIHLHYEEQPAPDGVEVVGAEHGDFAVRKLRLSKDRTTLTYNEHITLKNIPPRSFEYVVNGRSPLEWIIDRYQVKQDSASGIVNDPNAWALEHDNPRYILDLLLSCITVSLKTLEIVDALPPVEF